MKISRGSNRNTAYRRQIAFLTTIGIAVFVACNHVTRSTQYLQPGLLLDEGIRRIESADGARESLVAEGGSLLNNAEVGDIDRQSTGKMCFNKPANATASKGNVVVFFHVVKTGGTSIQYYLSKAPKSVVEYRFLNSAGAVARLGNKIDLWTKGIDIKPNQTKFVEFHAARVIPTYSQLLQNITQWRQTAKESGVQFSVFTILRDPVDWAVSAFNDMCLTRKKCYSNLGIKANLDAYTLDAVVSRQAPNIQCRFLSHIGWNEWEWRNASLNPTMQDCTKLHGQMLDQMDFVGSLENMDETSAYLKNILPKEVSWDSQEKRNKSKPKGMIFRSDLNETGLKHLEDIFQYDRMLHQKTVAHFRKKYEC